MSLGGSTLSDELGDAFSSATVVDAGRQSVRSIKHQKNRIVYSNLQNRTLTKKAGRISPVGNNDHPETSSNSRRSGALLLACSWQANAATNSSPL
jgi:hypothetical protein